MIFKNNKTYDFAKFMTQIILPATATLYFAIAEIWNLPYAKEVVGTISAVTVFMGSVLQISTKGYNRIIEEDKKNE